MRYRWADCRYHSHRQRIAVSLFKTIEKLYYNLEYSTLNQKEFVMKTFGKIIIASVVLGCIQQLVLSASDACRPNPKVADPK